MKTLPTPALAPTAVSLQVALVVAGTAFGQSSIYRIEGQPQFEELGYSSSRAGDVDADGTPDILFGAPAGSVDHGGEGRAIVISGATGQVLFQLTGGDEGDALGGSVSTAGDVDHDGHADLLIGAVKDDSSPGGLGCFAGAARIYSGCDGALIRAFHGDACDDEMGISVRNAGDVDDDGFEDQIVGITSGMARVFSGYDGSILYTFQGLAPGDRFGYAVGGAGDVNLDDHADLVVGAQFGNYAQVFSGADGSVILTLTGTGFFGCSVASVGDIDGDLHPDIAVGSYSDVDSPAHHVGSVRVFSGADGSLLHVFYGGNSNSGLGTSVGGGLDVNGDGWPDIIAGAPRAIPLSGDPAPLGEARVYSGQDGSLLFTVVGTEWSGDFGTSVDLVGDVDGDGRSDFAVGEIEYGTTGRAHVFSGACLPPLNYCTAKLSSLGCLPSMGYSGTPSISGPDDFHITASNILSRKLGLMFWSIREDHANVFGGIRCITSVIRTPPQNSGGAAVLDCSGHFDFHFSQAYMAAKGVDAGMTLYAQCFFRDPGFPVPNNVGLTDGLRFTICP